MPRAPAVATVAGGPAETVRHHIDEGIDLMRRIVIGAALVLAAVGATAGSAAASVYSVDVRGSQTLAWSFDAEIGVGGCATPDGNIPITRQYTGSGKMQLTFKSKQRGSGVVMRDSRGTMFASFDGGVVKATGNLQGSWSKSETRGGCPDTFTPQPAENALTSACGAQSWTMQVNGQNESNVLYVAGKEDLSGAASPGGDRYADCPLALSSGIDLQSVGEPGACEQRPVDQHRVSWELASLGRGLANVKLQLTRKLAGKKRIVLARQVTKRCDIAVIGANGTTPTLRVEVTTQITVAMRRTLR
jgi:hypothetical protein